MPIDIQRAVFLYENGKSVSEVAQELGCSKAGVKELLYRNGVQLRPAGGSAKGLNQSLNDTQVQQMYLSGLSSIEISQQLGCSVSGVKISLRRSGTEMRANGGLRTQKIFGGFMPTKEWMEAAMAYFGNIASDAAKHYSVPYATWIDWLEKFDIPRMVPGKALIGRPSHRREEIPLEEAIALSNTGTTYEELAQKYGVSYGVVMRRMSEVGHEPPPRRTRDERFRNISHYKRQILKQLNITWCEVCDIEKPLDFCHIKPQAQDGLTEEDNTLILCQNHHHLFDTHTLSQEEFAKIETKVRLAEQKYNWSYSS